MHAVPVRSKLGVAPKHLHFLSPRARRALSILFAGGLLFFAFLSFSIYVKDPESSSTKGGNGKLRRSLAVSRSNGGRIVSGRTVHRGGNTAVHSDEPLRLLLASHNRLFWYDVLNSSVQVLHEGEGVHYGVFPGDISDGKVTTLWNVIRPHNWHPKTSVEHLVQFNAETGKEISRVRIHSRFTHDAVRRGDRVYLANTEGGEVQELRFPSMKKLRGMKLFTLKQHVNTLAPLEEGVVWAMLHNLGKSEAVKIDLRSKPEPRVVATAKDVGTKAHGLVAWRGRLVVLDSERGALVTVDPGSGEVTKIWQTPADEDPQKFLKGLCVVDNVAYFGVNVWGSRESRDSKGNDAELAAVDLTTGALVFRRPVPTHGLLNIVAAPQLGEASTYRAMAGTGGEADVRGDAHSAGAAEGEGAGEGEGVAAARRAAVARQDGGEGQGGAGALPVRRKHGYLGGEVANPASDPLPSGSDGSTDPDGAAATGGDGDAAGAGSLHASNTADGSLPLSRAGVKTGIDDSRVEAANRKLIEMGYKPRISGYWSSGQPHLDLKVKDSRQSWAAGVSLPLLRVNISALKERIVNMPEDMWTTARQRKENAAVDGRKDNMNKFKPGVEALVMVFSDQSTEHVYRFPYYDYFKDLIEPILEQIVGRDDMLKVVRLQFARMKPGSTIKVHKDMGGYARFAHRIHLPIVSDANIHFKTCPDDERSQNRRLGGETDTTSCVDLPMEEGMVFELNNRVSHLVLNQGSIRRVQMVVDVAEDARAPRRLKPGTICNYVRAVMVCPEDKTLPDY
ncbi:hypothetical protein HYH03_000329 [Edaphochlamys debaryana]|uniref:Aspartyl/asparaginy/proline hydroxylase domain-containing protein n=1 Tax=Edaphochlamys debaryana TaxID=47281 RepID=A0A835YNR9_9CHLO|nr:hypothetical protein HYH03_000329 [Edaphochlamys debaryana]|eukprot:KAG2501830.1 hypothetical protein HYH03_000329 [Edaphochlamys debaryana]